MAAGENRGEAKVRESGNAKITGETQLTDGDGGGSDGGGVRRVGGHRHGDNSVAAHLGVRHGT